MSADRQELIALLDQLHVGPMHAASDVTQEVLSFRETLADALLALPETAPLSIEDPLKAAYHKGFTESRHYPNHRMPTLAVNLDLTVTAGWQ